ncbi:hypothetical protein CY34DRAFT_137535 [Suillus luteus UH-Slu-Lm8-n1]|uniref:Uncharacterized protein n=1 Tax=Suillus luteus UH-Slu-Lm8-n1 TaxID=930992 RepID=A0A0D0BHC7_9AGAM|nr:hypothetical protein CY34DRAFT_137535 [Suillus luteus UH-Slu-Lm8-n1]
MSVSFYALSYRTLSTVSSSGTAGRAWPDVRTFDLAHAESFRYPGFIHVCTCILGSATGDCIVIMIML